MSKIALGNKSLVGGPLFLRLVVCCRLNATLRADKISPHLSVGRESQRFMKFNSFRGNYLFRGKFWTFFRCHEGSFTCDVIVKFIYSGGLLLGLVTIIEVIYLPV